MTKNDFFEFSVNGTELKVEHQKVIAGEILELAANNGAIDGNPRDYILKSLTTDDKEYKWDDEVDLEEDKEFITIPTSPTPVA